MLTIIATHPVQYHAPVFRAVQIDYGVPVTAIYGSDFSITGYRDREFGAEFKWDTDLLSGYDSRFLSRVTDGGCADYDAMPTWGLRAALREVKPKAVLLLGYTPRFYRTAFYEVWRGGYPLMFRGETNDLASKRSRAKSLVRDTALRLLYSRVARFLYIGQRSREHYERLGCPANKLVFAPYCVDTTPFSCDEIARESMRDATRREYGIGADEIVAIFSGKLSPRKGPDLLVNALKQLPDDLRDKFRLLFLGAGEMQEEIRALASLTPQVKVTFTGFQNQTQLSRFYHAADFLVLPSRKSETWGLAVIEGLHHGLPGVVSETVGSAPDLIVAEETGYVFVNNSVESLRDALVRAAKLAQQPETRENCRQHVGKYTVTEAARGLVHAYREVAAI